LDIEKYLKQMNDFHKKAMGKLPKEIPLVAYAQEAEDITNENHMQNAPLSEREIPSQRPPQPLPATEQEVPPPVEQEPVPIQEPAVNQPPTVIEIPPTPPLPEPVRRTGELEGLTDAFMQVFTVLGAGAVPIENAEVTIVGSGDIVAPVSRTVMTDENGQTPVVTVLAPNREFSLDPYYKGLPYSTYSVNIKKEGFSTLQVLRVQVFAEELSFLPMRMIPLLEGETDKTIVYDTPTHLLVQEEG
jgi:hypothetical protein